MIDVVVVQSIRQILTYPRFHFLAKWLSLLKVVCWLKWILWIPLFWVLAMLVVQSRYLAIYFPFCIFHSNFLPMNIRLCWIRGTSQIRLLGVYSFFVRRIFWVSCNRHTVYGWINQMTQLIDGHYGAPTEVAPRWLGFIPVHRWYNPIR